MSSAVKSRPNYYELLGLKPTASAEDIGRAFAREIGLFKARPFGAVAQLGLAHETLRDPAKRRDYDESIGLRRSPPPAAKPPMPYITNAVFIRAPNHAGPPSKPALEAHVEKPLAPIVAEEPAPIAAMEPAVPSFLIADERWTGKPQAPAETPLAKMLPKIVLRTSPSLEDEDRPVGLNRTLAIAGSLVLAVGVLGAWAGSRAGQDAQDANAANAVTLRVPRAKPAQTVAEPVETEAPLLASAAPPRVDRFARASAIRRAAPAIAAEPAAPQPERSVAEQNQFARDSIAQATSTEPLALEATPAPVAASMPLSEATVARTIQRIGYACGKVAATSAGEGAGVFTVTCTSGQSFSAKPVRGRYHFRRIGR